ncbi:MAG: class I SAM-dependent methyltransferase, partial [Candidatus Hodarchaeales archaeon]
MDPIKKDNNPLLKETRPTYWSESSLKSKIGIWSPDQIQNFLIPLLNLKANEFVIDVGSGFSPLGHAFLPFLLPNGKILGIDSDPKIVKAANKLVEDEGKSKHMNFIHGDVMELSDNDFHSLADLVMCHQLLVNLPDPLIALEEMINLTKLSGRVLCIENINYGAFCSRSDFSWRSNLKLSQIWQKLCLMGKWGVNYSSTAFGAQLPLVFQELGLKRIQWRIMSPGIQPQPPFSKNFKINFIKNYKTERERLASFYREQWGPATDLTSSDIEYFIEHMILSDYDLIALEENKPLSFWYYPFMVIVGWIEDTEIKRDAELSNQTIHID